MSWFPSVSDAKHREWQGVLSWDAIRKRNRQSSDSWILGSFWRPQPWSHITTCPSTASKQEILVIHCLTVDAYKKGRIPRLIWDITMQCFVCVHAQLIQSYPTTLWTVAHQAPLSMEFSKQEYANGLPWPPLGHFLDPGIKPASPESSTLQVNSLPAEQPGKPIYHYYMFATSCRERTCLCSPKDLVYVQAILSLNICLSINLSKKHIF